MAYALGKTDHGAGAMKWNGSGNTTIYIFDLRKTNAEPRVMSTVPFYALHQINAFEKEDANGNVQLNIDLLAYTDAAFMLANATFGTLSVFRDVHKVKQFYQHPSFTPSKPTRISIDMASGKTTFSPYDIKDQSGHEIGCELPRINDAHRSKEYCIFYAYCVLAKDYKAQIGKIDLCTGKNELMYTQAEYPDEPVFVPNPAGTAEDEGVILMTKLDGVNKKTFLQVVDAQTLKEYSRIYAPIHHVAGIHAAFFPENVGITSVVV